MSDEHGAAGANPYAEEARQRWGHTDAYAESARRTKKYADADWARIREEQEGVERAFAEAMADGAPADGERATGVAEAARLHVDRWFYPCSHRMHVGLAEMYTADPRFRAHYDERAEGLAEYVAAAIAANAAKHEE